MNSLSEFLELTKPKVVLLIVFTAIVGMLLAVPDQLPHWIKVLFASIGIGFAAGSAAAINHLVDQRIDSIMLRTQHRPLPTGGLKPSQVIIFATVLGSIGLAILAWQINILTTVLTFVSLIGYAVIYTVFLKRATPQNIVIGGAAGAAPPVLGWAAMTGEVSYDALVLFLIIFVWTPPHFWALAVYRRLDYAKAEVPMLPVTHGSSFTCEHILYYSVLLLIVSIFPYLTRMSGVFYLGGALVLGIVFLYKAYKLNQSKDELQSMALFHYSILYLMLLFAFLLVDHYLPYAALS
ncbi:MAG: heme o synthase [bacterium]